MTLALTITGYVLATVYTVIGGVILAIGVIEFIRNITQQPNAKTAEELMSAMAFVIASPFWPLILLGDALVHLRKWGKYLLGMYRNRNIKL